jgi:UDP-N-acetylmuramoylalanine-D-glutamate ligase
MTGWAGRQVVVAGAGASGEAAARVLLRLGRAVTVVDRAASTRTEALAAGGAAIALGAQARRPGPTCSSSRRAGGRTRRC